MAISWLTRNATATNVAGATYSERLGMATWGDTRFYTYFDIPDGSADFEVNGPTADGNLIRNDVIPIGDSPEPIKP